MKTLIFTLLAVFGWTLQATQTNYNCTIITTDPGGAGGFSSLKFNWDGSSGTAREVTFLEASHRITVWLVGPRLHVDFAVNTSTSPSLINWETVLRSETPWNSTKLSGFHTAYSVPTAPGEHNYIRLICDPEAPPPPGSSVR